MVSRHGLADAVLQALYVGASFFCIFMLAWIFGFPATWRVGNTPGWDETLKRTWEQGKDEMPTPLTTVLKYSGQRAVQFTHTLPSAVWAAAVPLQLHPGFRKQYRKWHRRVGYAFFCAALSMMVGFVIIEYRHLDFFRADYATIPLHEATSAIGLDRLPHMAVFRGVAVAFLLFAALALRAAIRRDFASHKKWVLRHIGTGLWIAPQRMYVGLMKGRTLRAQKANFTDGIFVGLAITVVAAEVGVWIYHWQSLQQQQKAKPAGAQPVSNPAQGNELHEGRSSVEHQTLRNRQPVAPAQMGG